MSIIHIAFYPSDWLAGTRGLSDAETGVYITLIARMYEMAGPIERNDERLYRLCGCKSKSSFTRSLNYLISEGKIIQADGWIFNERVQKEIKITTEKSSKAQSAAQSRWDRNSNKNNVGDNANASLEHMPQLCQSESESELEEILAAAAITTPRSLDQNPGQIDPTERDQILSAIGVGTDGITGPNCHMIGTSVDMAEYRKWRSDPINLSLADVLAVIGGIMVRRRAKGSGPPGRFSYFSEAMAELSAARAGKITMPTAMRSTASSEEEKKLARWAAIAARGKTA